jgi:AraC-like DNA-binding protein
MTSLWQEARESLPPAHTQMLANILLDLTVACLEENGVPPSIHSDPMLGRMRDVIAARLEDFDFGPAAVAEEMGIPLRTAQTAAARAGTTISQMITEHRLQKAVRLLSSRPDASIGDIAFDCGFSDPSYFTRRFQSAYGASPSKFRSNN